MSSDGDDNIITGRDFYLYTKNNKTDNKLQQNLFTDWFSFYNIYILYYNIITYANIAIPDGSVY